MPTMFAQSPSTASLSDMLFLQNVEVIYTAAVVLIIGSITVGVLLWLFGHRAHRLSVTVLAMAGGAVAGWHVGGPDTIGPPLAMAIGAIVAAAVVYWLFPLWLGLVASTVIAAVLLSLYAWQFAIPYLVDAKSTSEETLSVQGLTLPPATDTQPTTMRSDNLIRINGDITAGRAYRNLELLLPRLSPASHESWEQWRDQFVETFRAVRENLSRIIPHLTLNVAIIMCVSLIVGLLLAFFKTDLVNMICTSAVGTAMICLAFALLLVIKPSLEVQWLCANAWVIVVLIPAMVVAGSLHQYHSFAEEVGEEDEEDDEEAEPPPPKPRRAKKK